MAQIRIFVGNKGVGTAIPAIISGHFTRWISTWGVEEHGDAAVGEASKVSWEQIMRPSCDNSGRERGVAGRTALVYGREL